VLENPKSKQKDLIDKKEFRKRRKEVFRKHGQTLQNIINIGFENKISWGTIVEENAQKSPNNIAIKYENIKITYKEFNDELNRYTHYFISLGLKKGDVVEIFMRNRPEFLIIFTAISKIGAISSLINTELGLKSLAYCLNLTPGKFIIVGSELIGNFMNVKSELNLSKDQKLLFSPNRDSITIPDEFIDLSQTIKNFPSFNPSSTIYVETNDPIAYFFTSGTTGLPKAVTIIHRSLVVNGSVFGLVLTEATPDDTIYVALPLYHVTAIWLGWAPAFTSGATLALSRKFSVSHFWDEIRKFNATIFTYVGE
jgi:acyl-CoA synthetase (AMP-forming)/AMP-acid ligase II